MFKDIICGCPYSNWSRATRYSGVSAAPEYIHHYVTRCNCPFCLNFGYVIESFQVSRARYSSESNVILDILSYDCSSFPSPPLQLDPIDGGVILLHAHTPSEPAFHARMYPLARALQQNVLILRTKVSSLACPPHDTRPLLQPFLFL